MTPHSQPPSPQQRPHAGGPVPSGAWSIAPGGSPSGDSLVAELVADCVRGCREQGRPRPAVTVDVTRPHEMAIAADQAFVRRAVEPLIRRAFESAGQATAVGERRRLCEVVVTSIDLGDAIEIEVADSGPSLPDAVRHWLNRSAAVRAAGEAVPEGAGLALAAVLAAVRRLSGTVRAANCPDGGVALTLRLPRRQAGRMAA